MSDQTPSTPEEERDPRFGEFAPDDAAVNPTDNPEDRDPGPDIPVKDWVPEPVFDSSEYLDREPPAYEGEQDEAPDETPDGEQTEGEAPDTGQREGEKER